MLSLELPSPDALVSQVMSKPAIAMIAGASVLLFAWRLWRFTITPYFYPADPRELPYWIPFVGHAVGFFRNSYKVLEKGRLHFRNSKEPYCITVAGQRIYILTCPEDVKDVYKHTTSISWSRFVQDLYRWIGIAQPNIDKLWCAPTDEAKALHPQRRLPPIQMVEEYQMHQLLPGGKLEDVAKMFVKQLDRAVCWQGLTANSPYVLESSPESVKVFLLGWTEQVFISITTEIFWGKSIWKISPGLIDTFLKWENTTWKYVFQLPRFLSKDMYTARDQLIDAFTNYYGQANGNRADANWYVNKAEAEYRDLSFNDHDLAKVNMLQHWAVNGNIHKVTFWVFAYLAHDAALLEAIRTETLPGVVNDSPDVPYLTGQCPRLEALYLEVLRLEMSSSLMRYVTEPTMIGGKLLREGNNVMVPYRQLHYSEDIWGENASAFDPERFLRKKGLSRSSSFRPFGGGQHLCPGRFLAKQAVFTFVALALSRFDVRLDTDSGMGETGGASKNRVQRFPRADESKPGLGALAPVAGDGVILRLKPRTTSVEKPLARS